MAIPQEPRVGEKRGPGRPPKSATPAAKRLRTSIAAASTPSSFATPATPSSAVESPAPVSEKRAPKLPAKLVDNRPLPSLLEPQPLDLSRDEYQSIAASAVLEASLNRSRSKWVCDGIFQRYWVKPESGKNAKPLPPNNPEVKFMKGKGECRIRLEPHLLVAEVYVEEKPRPKQFPQNSGAYVQQYRPPPVQQAQHRPVQPVPNPATPRSTQQSSSPAVRSIAGAGSSQQQDKKTSPDPVISMLASRASSDPELKALMKEVATGNATPDQLRVFQRHIDELTAIIMKQKKDEEEQSAKATRPQSASTTTRYDGAAESSSSASTPMNPSQQHSQQQGAPYSTSQPVPMYQPQSAWTPTHLPVILEFKTAGATEDRFLFPQHSILETLSPQHELVSFIVTRKGRDAADPAGLDPAKEYWQPVTMMVEVAYGREGILKNIRDWVKPADQVRKHMEETMQRCQRAPATFLALRLPVKASAAAESEEVSKDSTPIVEVQVEKIKAKPGRKPLSLKTSTDSPLPAAAKRTSSAAIVIDAPSAVPEPLAAASDAQAAPLATATEDGSMIEANDTGRPKRAVRKSVRISEG